MHSNADQPAPPDHPQPTLLVIAGPNGAGKTTLTQQVLRHEWFEGCVYVNPDDIARERFGDWNSPDAVRNAVEYAEQVREECIATGQSLAFETVFSTEDKLSFVRRASASGFFVRLFYVGTDNPMINASRVAGRVLEGGHDVPITKIISRFNRSAKNLGEIIPEIERAYVYDNSAEGVLPALQFRTVQGVVEKVYDEEHGWADSIRARITNLHLEQSGPYHGGHSY